MPSVLNFHPLTIGFAGMDQALLKEELDRLYRLFGDQARGFRRNLYILIVAGLAVFMLLVVPFLSFRDEAARTEAVLTQLMREVAELQGRLILAEAAVAALAGLKVETRRFRGWGLAVQRVVEEEREADRVAERVAALKAEHADSRGAALRAWVESDALVPGPDVFHGRAPSPLPPIASCTYYGGLTFVVCRMCAELRARQEEWTHAAAPAARLDATAFEQWRDLMETEFAAVCDFDIDAPEAHAHSGGTRSALTFRISSANTNVVDATDRFALRLHRAFREVEERLAVAETSQERASARVRELQANLERISTFNRIGTPMGDLPIGLGQLVLLFPVVLGLAFIAVAGGYGQMAATQRAFLRLCAKRDAAGAVMDAQHLRVIAPLWLDRGEAPGARIAHWLVVLAPVGLLAFCMWMIWHTQALDALLPDDAAIPAPAFVALYGLTGLGVLAGVVQVARAARARPDAPADPVGDAPERS